MPIFDHHHLKIIKVTFGFSEFLSTHRKSIYSINSYLRVGMATPILTMFTPIFFNRLLIVNNLYQHTKKQNFSSIFSRDNPGLKILQSDWLRAFWPISQVPDFFQEWDLCKNTAININIIERPNSEKIMTKFSNKFKNLFLANPALSHTTPHGPLTPC